MAHRRVQTDFTVSFRGQRLQRPQELGRAGGSSRRNTCLDLGACFYPSHALIFSPFAARQTAFDLRHKVRVSVIVDPDGRRAQASEQLKSKGERGYLPAAQGHHAANGQQAAGEKK